MNGPNLNLLGIREQSIYGNRSFEDYLDDLKTYYSSLELRYFQSNIEGELIDTLHEWRKSMKGVVLNAGGYTHTSVAIHDAIKAIQIPVIEVHISQPLSREEFRHTSLIAKACAGSISGFGLNSYELALEAFSRGSVKP